MKLREGLSHKENGTRRTQDRTSICGKKTAASLLGAFAALVLALSGIGAVCAEAGTTTAATKVIKTANEEEFADETSELVKKNRGTVSSMKDGDENEEENYSSGRLIARIEDGKKANLTSYGADTIIQSSFGVNIIQFSSASAAKKAAKKITALPAVSYVESDDISIDVGDDEITEITFEGSTEEESFPDYPVTGTDRLSLKEIPTFTGNEESDTTGYDMDEEGKDVTYDTSIKSGAVAASATAMSWGVSYMKADKYAAYIKSRTSRSIKVAIVDSGVSSHTKLKGRLLSGIDFVDNDKNPADSNGHGTHLAGTVVDCTPGLKVYILPVRAMDSSGMGTPSIVGNGIRYAVNAGAKVINLSLGGDTHYNYLEECISYAHKKGVTVVVASGNSNDNTQYCCPAHMSSPIVVSSIDKNGDRAFYSNYGKSVDVAAPGVDVVSCWKDGGYAIASGTSMAAPHIAAVAAMYRLIRPGSTPAQIEKLVKYYVKDLGSKGRDNYYGTGVPVLTKGISPSKVTLNKTSASLEVKKTLTLKASITPSYAGMSTKLTWSSSNSSVASVSGGKVTAKKKGTATITVKTANGKKATCKITVTGIQPTSVKLSATSKTLKVGKAVKLYATISPSNAEKKITWTSSSPSVATVTAGGSVIAKKAGTTTITAKTVNGKKATCKVKVVAASN